ncbi:breast cancer anti-estrogen resistance protein 1 isoform X2 [Octopus bimaculoides]|uniref:breast cancer anti-estrogen resistance protein 1 isoform X2 n=1 Tax=Octopus bimaculoides TaxID=37653 RepID=UPI00071DF2DD|nr:breast cancer anti-estrogen resistance protein 1 isoform X2 [Octopus bimaculoides]|eukprot:XP_014772039.1 PREDICTED: breast cancer anti-estrogen resistance protein 1-like isoform X2 [Octopus bimaculoides]
MNLPGKVCIKLSFNPVPPNKSTKTTPYTLMTTLAKAIYDNLAESANELAFRRGDVLAVLEQDTDGMVGWWRCTFRGKTGIAPGNRLKILTGMSNLTSTPNKDSSSYDQNPSLASNWHRRSWDVTPNKVGQQADPGGPTYDHPPVRHTPEDYDVPPTQSSDSNSDLQANYDTPKERRFDQSPDQSICNYPSTSLPADSSFKSFLSNDCDTYDVPPSNRSSMASFKSTESTMTLSSSASNQSLPRSSNTSSLCDSARSSLDASAVYDVPPDHSSHNLKQQFDSVLDLYDTPPSHTKTSPSPSNSAIMDDYDVPKSAFEDYDLPPVEPPSNNFDMPSLAFEQDLGELYDTPKNAGSNNELKKIPGASPVSKPAAPPVGKVTNAASPHNKPVITAASSVYDIPPQVSRDSLISAKSDSSDGQDAGRLSSCSTGSRGSDIPIYNELPLAQDVAMDLLVKRQQDVLKAINKMSPFISSSWRQRNNLEPNLHDIRAAADNMQMSLADFVEFAEGTLANSVSKCDRKLVNKLYKLLTPLQQALQQILLSIKNLSAIQWQINLLVSSNGAKDDDLGKIANLSKTLTIDVRNLASFIQGNSVLLFKNSDISGSQTDFNKTDSIVVPVPTKSGSIGSMEAFSKSIHGRRHSSGSVQNRPLPPPPPVNRPLPPTPSQLTLLTKPDTIPSKRSPVIINVSKKEDPDSLDFLEYDYVQLETRDPSPEKVVTPSTDVPSKQTSVRKDQEQSQKGNEKSEPNNMNDPVSSLEAAINSMQLGSSSLLNLSTGTKEINNRSDVDSPFSLANSTEYSKEVQDISRGLDYVSLSKSLEIDFDQELKTPVNTTSNTDVSGYNSNINGGVVSENNFHMKRLAPNDRQVLLYYSEQMNTHYTLLNNSIEAFYNCIDSIQTPKVFISNSKFVVLSATKMVYIGDTLHRNLMDTDFRNRILHCTTLLCNNLKSTVAATKTAAIYYPSVQAVQDMVNRVKEVFRVANELKNIIGQASFL